LQFTNSWETNWATIIQEALNSAHILLDRYIDVRALPFYESALQSAITASMGNKINHLICGFDQVFRHFWIVSSGQMQEEKFVKLINTTCEVLFCLVNDPYKKFGPQVMCEALFELFYSMLPYLSLLQTIKLNPENF